MTYNPIEIIKPENASRWVITCDHATNTVPPFVNGGDLGIADADMNRHIAYDVGAAGVTRALAAELNASAILSNFSRLVIDPNRGEDDPTLVMRLYDGTIIPANRHADADEIQRRLDRCYHPYHNAYGDLLKTVENPVVIAMHSYTDQLKGYPPRPWHIGFLFGHDERLSAPLLKRFAQEPDLCVGANEPYGGHLDGDAVDKQLLKNGHLNVLIEIRNDLIKAESDQIAWAKRLAPILTEVLDETGL